MENLEFWNKYKEVPKSALKPFDNGKFAGTDINTMWRLKCLTETYGKCGFGWYFKPIKLWTETITNGEVFAFAEIELFIKENNEWSMPISGTGGNKMLRLTKSGTSSSDEAYKMAITDAIGVACRNLGIGADIYWEHDKTKYSEFEPENNSNLLKLAEKENINLVSYAKYIGKKVNEVTEEDLQRAIEMKKDKANGNKKDK